MSSRMDLNTIPQLGKTHLRVNLRTLLTATKGVAEGSTLPAGLKGAEKAYKLEGDFYNPLERDVKHQISVLAMLSGSSVTQKDIKKVLKGLGVDPAVRKNTDGCLGETLGYAIHAIALGLRGKTGWLNADQYGISAQPGILTKNRCVWATPKAQYRDKVMAPPPPFEFEPATPVPAHPGKVKKGSSGSPSAFDAGTAGGPAGPPPTAAEQAAQAEIQKLKAQLKAATAKQTSAPPDVNAALINLLGGLTSKLMAGEGGGKAGKRKSAKQFDDEGPTPPSTADMAAAAKRRREMTDNGVLDQNLLFDANKREQLNSAPVAFPPGSAVRKQIAQGNVSFFLGPLAIPISRDPTELQLGGEAGTQFTLLDATAAKAKTAVVSFRLWVVIMKRVAATISIVVGPAAGAAFARHIAICESLQTKYRGSIPEGWREYDARCRAEYSALMTADADLGVVVAWPSWSKNDDIFKEIFLNFQVTLCLQCDGPHVTANCPELTGAASGPVGGGGGVPKSAPRPTPLGGGLTSKTDSTCRGYNAGFCRFEKKPGGCKCLHNCSVCGRGHPAMTCPTISKFDAGDGK